MPPTDRREPRAEYENKRSRPMYRADDPSLHASLAGSPHSVSYTSTESPNRARFQPPQPVIDLTSSPYRSSTGGQYMPRRQHMAAEPNSHTHVPGPSRRSPPRELRGAYYDARAAAAPQPYIPDHRMYERPAPPARGYSPMRGDRDQLHVGQADARFLRSGVRYGG